MKFHELSTKKSSPAPLQMTTSHFPPAFVVQPQEQLGEAGLMVTAEAPEGLGSLEVVKNHGWLESMLDLGILTVAKVEVQVGPKWCLHIFVVGCQRSPVYAPFDSDLGELEDIGLC